uniref:GIY-YIG domain-containing protein n=1 Tax=Tetrabaena socialis TaxID=47790 RepID=A0A1B1FK44_9CHLO|nr:hypothetical protein [Tetrabaena socialis]
MTINNQYAGYYIILNIDTKIVYTGISMDLNRRFTEHKRDLKANKHKNPTLQKAWADIQTKTSSAVDIVTIFPLITDYEKNKLTAKLVFIPILKVLVKTYSTDKEKEALFAKFQRHEQDGKGLIVICSPEEKALIKAELAEHEETVSILIEKFLHEQSVDCIGKPVVVPSANFWLKLGTDARESVAVCIDGVFYKNKSVAANALKIFTNENKPNKRFVIHRLETAKWKTWCIVSDNKLIKKVRKMDSKGNRIGYKILQYGEVQTSPDNKQVALYWETPIELLG